MESALRSAIGIFKEHGIWIAILVFILVLSYSVGKKHIKNNPKKIEHKELTREEHIKEGNQEMLGCIIGIILIAGLTWLFI